MNKLFTLVGVMIKNGAATMGFAHQRLKRKNAKRKTNNLTLFIGILLFMTAIFTISFIGIGYGTNETDPNSTADILASQSVYMTFFFSICFSFVMVFSNYFMANDDHFYLHLPLKTTTIWMAKFLATLFLTFMMTFASSLAFLIAYPICLKSFPILLIINTLLVYFGITFIVFALSFLIGLFLTVVCKLNKHKEIMTIISGLIAIVAGIMVGLASSLTSISSSFGQLLLYPTLSLLSTDITSLLYGLAIFGIGVGSCLIAVILAKYFYLKSISGSSDQRKSKKLPLEILDKKIDKACRKQSTYSSYFKREMKSIFRSGAITFNTLLPSLIFMVMAVIMSILFRNMLLTVQAMTGMYLLFVIVSPNVINYGSAISYSKDSFSFLQLAGTPIDQKVLLRAKVSPYLLFNLLNTLVIIVVGAIALKINIFVVLICCVCSILFSIADNYALAFIDLKKGTYSITSEFYVAKTSRSVIFASLFQFLIVVPFVLLTIPLFTTEVNPLIICVAILGLCSFMVVIPLLIEKNIYNLVTGFVNR